MSSLAAGMMEQAFYVAFIQMMKIIFSINPQPFDLSWFYLFQISSCRDWQVMSHPRSDKEKYGLLMNMGNHVLR